MAAFEGGTSQRFHSIKQEALTTDYPLQSSYPALLINRAVSNGSFHRTTTTAAAATTIISKMHKFRETKRKMHTHTRTHKVHVLFERQDMILF